MENPMMKSMLDEVMALSKANNNSNQWIVRELQDSKWVIVAITVRKKEVRWAYSTTAGAVKTTEEEMNEIIVKGGGPMTEAQRVERYGKDVHGNLV